MNNDYQKVINNLAKLGYRQTKLREYLLGLFYQNPSPLSAGQIIQALDKKIRPVNKTTIYRQLALLTRLKIINEELISSDQTYYELADRPHHHHLICQHCRKVEDVIVEKEPSSLEKFLSTKTNFKITGHSLEFFGLCPRCQK